MNVPGWRLHPLTGALTGHCSCRVSGNWRLSFYGLWQAEPKGLPQVERAHPAR
ncbi:hypothetical protein [uncultured Thiodictyon sp.]|uniref:hypothetical protein n=1 Tax=uncultured Thiodictyon sp. TaxID=1846217 RepID=UPI0025CCF6C9|nr:hypothetical protein [uncultured Thiodictyon sp.]